MGVKLGISHYENARDCSTT